MSFKVVTSVAVVCAMLVASAMAQELPKRFTNQDVIDMVQLGLSEAVIIEKIRAAQDPGFDTTVDGLKALHAAGVPDDVIMVMINPKAGLVSPAQAMLGGGAVEDPNLPPKEVGIWWKDGNKWVFVEGQNVSKAKLGGRWGSFATMGVKAKHWNAHINGKTSRNVVKDLQPVFYFYVLEGTSAADFTLLKLDRKGDGRQFEVGSIGGIVGGKSGVREGKMRGFDFERVAARTYKVTPVEPLKPGEYGFFMGTGSDMEAAGSAGAAQGRIYDFAIPK